MNISRLEENIGEVRHERPQLTVVDFRMPLYHLKPGSAERPVAHQHFAFAIPQSDPAQARGSVLG
jgi:hypothetical protein